MSAPPPTRSASLAALEARLDYVFRDPGLLELALTHRSHAYEVRGTQAPGTDNEQLEFLGDAVLGLLVTEALLREFPGCTEGELTRLRSALVSRARMAELARALALGDHLLLGAHDRALSKRTAHEQPTLLANAAEAVLAAIYLDAGADALPVLRALLERLLLQPDRPALQAAVDNSPDRGALRDSKTLLQEQVQRAAVGRVQYIDLDHTGPPHDRMFTVEARLQPAEGEPRLLGRASGRSKKSAQQAAAAMALENWRGEDIDASPRAPAIGPPA